MRGARVFCRHPWRVRAIARMLLLLREKFPTTAVAPASEMSGVPARRAAAAVVASPRPVSFTGWTRSRGELLRSPVSGQPCVHWRLRIAEQVNPSLRLVHEIASTEDFDVAWVPPSDASSAAASAAEARVRVPAEASCIQATPILHAMGSPGALSIARQYGFAGALSVEEVMLRENAEIVAEGFFDGCFDGDDELDGLNAAAAAPFREVVREVELLGATVRVPARAVLAPVLLPWALGAAAAVLGGVGAATWAAWRFDLVPRFHAPPRGREPASEIGPRRVQRRHFSVPE